MYCSKCGSEINKQLNYCNICGLKLVDGDKPNDLHKPILIGLVVSLGVVSIAGLGCFIGLLAMLLARGVRDELIVILSGGYLLTLISLVFILSRQISKFTDEKSNRKAENQTSVFQPVQLPAKNTAQLGESKQQPFSVVDSTTRTFDESFVKRK